MMERTARMSKHVHDQIIQPTAEFVVSPKRQKEGKVQVNMNALNIKEDQSVTFEKTFSKDMSD